MKKVIIVKNIAKAIRQFHESIVLKGTKGIIQKSAKISPKTLQKLKKKCIVNRMSCMYIERFFQWKISLKNWDQTSEFCYFFMFWIQFCLRIFFLHQNDEKKNILNPNILNWNFITSSFTLFRTVIKLHLKKKRKKRKT